MIAPATDATRSAARDAARLRAAALLRLTQGTATLKEIIEEACTEHGRPLLRIGLRQLLIAQPRVGAKRADELLARTFAALEMEAPARPTLGWLLDARAGGRRFVAFCDVLVRRFEAPWPGFPFAPNPSAQPPRGTTTSKGTT